MRTIILSLFLFYCVGQTHAHEWPGFYTVLVEKTDSIEQDEQQGLLKVLDRMTPGFFDVEHPTFIATNPQNMIVKQTIVFRAKSYDLFHFDYDYLKNIYNEAANKYTNIPSIPTETSLTHAYILLAQSTNQINAITAVIKAFSLLGADENNIKRILDTISISHAIDDTEYNQDPPSSAIIYRKVAYRALTFDKIKLLKLLEKAHQSHLTNRPYDLDVWLLIDNTRLHEPEDIFYKHDKAICFIDANDYPILKTQLIEQANQKGFKLKFRSKNKCMELAKNANDFYTYFSPSDKALSQKHSLVIHNDRFSDKSHPDWLTLHWQLIFNGKLYKLNERLISKRPIQCNYNIACNTKQLFAELTKTLDNTPPLKKCNTQEIWIRISGIQTIEDDTHVKKYMRNVPEITEQRILSVTEDSVLYRIRYIGPKKFLDSRLAYHFDKQAENSKENILHYRLKL